MKTLLHCTILTACLFCLASLTAREAGNSRQAGNEPDTTLAREYFERAMKLAEDAQYDSSNYYSEKAAAIYQKAALTNDQVELWVYYIDCNNLVGDNLMMSGKLTESRLLLEQTLKLSVEKLGEAHLSTAAALVVLGRTLDHEDQEEQASIYLRRALDIRKKLLGENHNNVAVVYNMLGNVAMDIGKFEPALDYYRKALTIRLKILPADHPDIAAIYNNIGYYYYGKGDYQRTAEFMTRSLNIFRNHYKQINENHPYVALNSSNLGYVYYLQGDYGRAAKYVNKALAIYRNIFAEAHPEVGQCYNMLGLIETALGNSEQAIRHHTRAMDIYIQTTGPGSNYSADGHYGLANAYMARDDYENSIRHYLQALEIYSSISGDSHPLLPTVLNETGIAYAGKGDYGNAIIYHKKVLDVDLGRNHTETGNAYLNLGHVSRKQNKVKEALRYYQKAIGAFTGDFRNSPVYANPSLADIVSAPGLLNALTAKADVFKMMAESDKSAETSTSRRKSLKNLKAALAAYDLAVKLIDKVRFSYKAEDSKLFLSQRVDATYRSAIQTALELYGNTNETHYQHQAFTFAEKNRAAVLNEALQESRAREFAGIPDSLLEQERSLRIDLAFYNTQIQKYKNGHAGSLRLAEFQNLYFDRKVRYDRLIASLEQHYPRYYDLKYRTNTASVSHVQKALDDRTALIEFSVGNDSLYIFTITNNQFEIYVQPIDATFFETVVSLRKAIKKVESNRYLRTSSALFNTLIQPVEPLISAYKKWIVIPDGVLHYLPFEALVKDSGRGEGSSGSSLQDRVDFSQLNYLIKNYQISYHYSATLFLSGLTNNQHRTTDHGPQTTNFIGFAPVFSDEIKNGYILAGNSESVNSSNLTDEVRSVTIDGRKFRALPNSEGEVTAIVNAFADKKLTARAYFHNEASEESFKNMVGKADFVHIATHGIVNEKKPKLSGLVFSQPQDSTETEDGILYAGETFNLNLNADLIVLSSCESGLGRLVKGEGLLALTRGFLYSGARNVVVSLWKVYDKHTRDLMVALYRNILSSGESVSGRSYAQSLRKAKLKMIADPATAFPKKWSGFVLVGR